MRVDLFPELRRILEAGELCHFGQSIAQLVEIDERVERPVDLDNLFLLLDDLHQEGHALVVGSAAKGNVDRHVHAVVPAARVDRDELIPQADNLRLVLVLHDKLENALEAPLQAIGEQTRDHLNALLRRRQLRLDSRAGGRLQHVCVEALRGARDARALRLDLVHVGQHAEGGLADKRLDKGSDRARLAHPNDGAGFRIHGVVEVHLALNHRHARIDRLRQAVEGRAHDRRLDQLQIHRLVGDRLTENRVRRRIRRKDCKRRMLNDFVVQDVGAIADRADLMQLGDTVAVLIDPHIALNVEDPIGRFVCCVCDAKKRLICRIADENLEVLFKAARAGVLLDDVAVVAHRHQLGDRRQLAAPDIDRVVDVGRFAVDQELLGRNALDDVARSALRLTDPQRIERHADRAVELLEHLFDEYPRLVLDHHHFVSRQAGIRVILDALVVDLVPGDDAGLEDQSVFHGVVQDPKAGVLLHENVIDQVCGLLGGFDVFRHLRHELDDLLRTRKDPQQRRQHRQDRVAHFRQNDLRAPVFLVAELVAEVVRHRRFALGREVAVDVALRVLDRLAQNKGELFVVDPTLIRNEKTRVSVQNARLRDRRVARIVFAGEHVCHRLIPSSERATTASHSLSRLRVPRKLYLQLSLHHPSGNRHRP